MAAIDARNPVRVYSQGLASFHVAFSLPEPQFNGPGIAWTDYDGDGLDDLVTSTGPYSNPSMLRIHNDGPDGLHAGAQTWLGQALLHGLDANGDGAGDVFVLASGHPDSLYLASNGQLPVEASWTQTTAGYCGEACAIAVGVDSGDVDGDGRLDAAIGYEFGGERLVRFGGDGPELVWTRQFYDSRSVIDAAVVDFDGDGRLDVVFSEQGSFDDSGVWTPPALIAFRWDGSTLAPMFSTEDPTVIGRMAWTHFGSSPDPTLAVCRTGGLGVYHRTPSGFHPITVVPSVSSCTDPAWGDFDGDGDIDLAVGGNAVRIFENINGAFYQIYEDDVPASSVTWGRCGATSDGACFEHALAF